MIPASMSASANPAFSDRKAEPGMHRLGTGRSAGGDDLLHVQVGRDRWVPDERHGLVGVAHSAALGVGRVMNGDRGDPETPQGGDDANRDLAAVGDQDLGRKPAHGADVASSRPPPSQSAGTSIGIPKSMAANDLPCGS